MMGMGEDETVALGFGALPEIVLAGGTGGGDGDARG